VLFFDVIDKVPNLKEAPEWKNQNRIVNMMAFNTIQTVYQVGFYEISVGKNIPMFTLMP
jgi:hypothetical protein